MWVDHWQISLCKLEKQHKINADGLANSIDSQEAGASVR